jgi:phosphatidylinositol alpha-mannosyltransferase
MRLTNMVQNTKLKIGLVLDDSLDKPDGVQQYILGIGQWLTSVGHDVHYLVGQTSRTDIPNVHSLSRNINVRFNANRMSIPLPTSRRSLKAFLDAEQFDVLHVQTPYSPWLAHRLIQAAGERVAVIGTFHIVAYSKVVEMATKLLALWVRNSVRRFDEIVSVSAAAVDYAHVTYGINTKILPNVVDYPRFHGAQPLPQYNDDTITILFLGRLVQRKGCLTLLQAINELKNVKTLPKYRVIICGKGPLDSELKTYAREQGIVENVEFVGFVSEADKPRYYASADISVFPSQGGESFGIVLLEAMASGKAAVLGGDNSGYRSVLEPRPDLLFDPFDASSLATKIQHFLEDAASRKRYALWGSSYTAEFDVATVGLKLVTIYERALRNRANR